MSYKEFIGSVSASNVTKNFACWAFWISDCYVIWYSVFGNYVKSQIAWSNSLTARFKPHINYGRVLKRRNLAAWFLLGITYWTSSAFLLLGNIIVEMTSVILMKWLV